MEKIYIKLEPARALNRVVEKAAGMGTNYTAYVRDDFDPSNSNHLADLASEMQRAGKALNVNDKMTEDDLRRLKMGVRTEVRIN